MKKRFLGTLLVLAILLAMLPTVIFAAETDFSTGDTGTAKIAPPPGYVFTSHQIAWWKVIYFLSAQR